MHNIVVLEDLVSLKQKTKDRLEKEYGLSGHKKADALFKLAWHHGWNKHRSIFEVENCYIDFVDLI